MKLQSKYADLVLNLLVAVAISLVVNFSYVLLMLVDLNSDSQPRPSDQDEPSIAPDEEANAVGPVPTATGTWFTRTATASTCPRGACGGWMIAPGDRIVADLMPPRSEKAHPMLAEIRTRNGAEFDYSKLYNGPSKMTELLLQLFYYLVVSFVMLSILTSVRRNYSMSRFVRRCLWCCVAAAALYCVAPVTEWHTGRIGLNFMSGRMFDYMLLLKCSFAVVASMLYGLHLRADFPAAGRRRRERAAQERKPHHALQHARRDRSTPISSSTRSTRWRCSCARSTTRRP